MPVCFHVVCMRIRARRVWGIDADSSGLCDSIILCGANEGSGLRIVIGLRGATVKSRSVCVCVFSIGVLCERSAGAESLRADRMSESVRLQQGVVVQGVEWEFSCGQEAIL